MARETKAALAARIAADNAAAAAVPAGSTATSDLFGVLTLGANLGPSENSGGWDQYEVQHSGFTHVWSSAVVARAFPSPAASTQEG